ncbi:MFS transporter (plasmid) [Brevibacillus laterosporus]|uniref:MFS transporter n=1 Tax=Brevibacillus laterosporus TaxID=1465 RepID=UPI000E6D57B1|nr:MFS transporter [Brevibacillus laterosporus]AYB41682.1 MFS transporter [Brevibacillus laterosporus]
MITRSFYYLLGTQTLSNIADIIYLMGLISLVFNSTDSLMMTIFIPLFRFFSKSLSGLLAPLVLSRYRLPIILLVSQFGQFVLFAILLVYLWMVPDEPSYPIIFFIVFGMSFLDGVTNPVRNALVPRLALGEGLMKANGFISVSDHIVRCAGWALSGVIVVLIGSHSTLTLALVSYFIAMIFTSFIKDPLDMKKEKKIQLDKVANVTKKDKSIEVKESFWSDFSKGWKIIGHNRRIRTLTIIDTLDTIGGTAWIGVFVLAFIKQVLNRDESWLGLMNGSFFAGSIVGGLLVVALVKRLQKRSFIFMLIGFTVYILLAVFFAINTHPLLALVLMTLTGPPIEIAAVIRRTLFQQSIDAIQLPKVLAALEVVINLTFGVSLLMLGWFADQFGMTNLYLFAAFLTSVAVVVGFFNRSMFSDTEMRKKPEETSTTI